MKIKEVIQKAGVVLVLLATCIAEAFSQNVEIRGVATQSGPYSNLEYIVRGRVEMTDKKLVFRPNSQTFNTTQNTQYTGKPLSYFGLSSWPAIGNLNMGGVANVILQVGGKEFSCSITIHQNNSPESHVAWKHQTEGVDINAVKFIKAIDATINHQSVKQLEDIIDQKRRSASQANNSSGNATSSQTATRNTAQQNSTNTNNNTPQQNATSTDSFWDDAPVSRSRPSNPATGGNQGRSLEEQAASARKVSEEANRQAGEKLDNYFSSERTRLQNEQANKLSVLANSYYANEARSRADQGISQNSSFDRKFDNVEDLQNAFYQQSEAINQHAQESYEARMQQNANNLEYHWGTSTGTDRAIGEVATGIANIVGSVRAERERKEAQARLEKERKEQLAAIEAEKKRIEAERRQKILALRDEVFKQFPEGGVPLSRHNVQLNELYFFTYSQNSDKTVVKVSNVFPYARYKDGTWAFKDRVTAESQKIAGSNVTLVGYYTTKELAEKERGVFVQLLPRAEVTVNTFEVKGRKTDGTGNGTTDFWGNELQSNREHHTDNKNQGGQTKTESTSTSKKTDDFWGDAPTKTDKKTETKKKDDFWNE